MNSSKNINNQSINNRGGTYRQSNFELLRIVCMLLIICGHLIMAHGYNEVGDSSWMINQILNPFTSIAVNTFILISGYFGIKLNYKKLININWMVTFYSVCFLVITLYLGIHKFDPMKDWRHLFPVLTKQYWFITIYFALCFLSPYLNIIVERLTKQAYNKLLITVFAIFCVLPTLGFVFGFQSITNDAGYGIVNFCFLYLLGRYLKLHWNIRIRRVYYLLGYLLSMSLCAGFHIIYSGILGFSFDSLISYDTIFILIGSICVFLYFEQISFNSLFINKISKYCLAVYVLHINPQFFKYLMHNMLYIDNNYIGVHYVIYLLIVTLLLFAICCLIEYIRYSTVTLLKKNFAK